MTFCAGDFISARIGPDGSKSSFFQLEATALPDVQGKTDAFLVAYKLIETAVWKDLVLQQLTYTASKEPTLLHISSVEHDYPHFFTYQPAERPTG